VTLEGLPSIEPSANLTDKVHDALVTAIASRELEPGSLYSVKDLAEQFGVSRTPVREAMLQLDRRGLVEILRNQGVRILERTREDLESIFELRLWVEVPAAREAAVRRTPEEQDRFQASFDLMRELAERGDRAGMLREDRRLHFMIVAASGNLRAARTMDELRDFVMSQGQSTGGRSRSLIEIVDEHTGIVEALAAADPEAAGEAIEGHIASTRDLLIAQQFG